MTQISARQPNTKMVWRSIQASISLVLLSLLCSAYVWIHQSNYQISTPINENSSCKLHYSHFHLVFTLPPLTILYVLAKPFLTQLDYSKLIILPIIAFVWTTPWDNELVRKGAWWYPRSCILARIGYVPVEEYAFFILQSLITSLLTILITRWPTPRSFDGKYGSVFALLLPIVPTVTFLLGVAGLLGRQGSGHHFYISMIAWWASVPLTLLWYGTRRSWIGLLRNNQAKPWLMCLFIPTAYLCYADVFALRRGTWHITEAKSLERFLVPDLPIEEATFFLVTNLILVSACFAFDRVVWQCRKDQCKDANREFAPMSPTSFRLSWSVVPTIWSTFLNLDNDTEPSRSQSAQDRALSILQVASKSFHTASTLLPWDLRIDLGCLYAFARAMDDFIDVEQLKQDEKISNKKLDLLRELVCVAFDGSQNVTDEKISKKIDKLLEKNADLFPQHEHEGQKQQEDIRTSAQAASTLRGIVPTHLWEELLDGYTTDCQKGGPRFTSFHQLASYAQDVAGSIGEMCVRVVLARSGVLVDNEYRTVRDLEESSLTSTATHKITTIPTLTLSPKANANARKMDGATVLTLLRDARRMGVSLQLINIARDVVKDAKELQRCYLVIEDKRNGRSILRDELLEFNQQEVVNQPLLEQIFEQKMSLVRLAREIHHVSLPAVSFLPDIPAQTGLRVACAVYLSIGMAIERDEVENCHIRSKVSTWERMLIAFKAIYM